MPGGSLLGPPSVAKPIDRMPQLRGAGLQGDSNGETAEKIIKPEFFAKAPPTPPHVKKWRKEVLPGAPCLHPGIAGDKDHERIAVYGKAEPVGVKVHEVLNTAPKSQLISEAIEKKEAIYLSHKREPLEKPYVRGHSIPADLAATGFGRWPLRWSIT